MSKKRLRMGGEEGEKAKAREAGRKCRFYGA